MFLLRWETLRRLIRVISLLALDFIGVTAALFTAILVKLLLEGNFGLRVAWTDTRPALAFAYLITVLMFARADLYADRPRRPGLAKIVSALFQSTVIALVFALANGEHFSSYYIFYGSLFFGDRLPVGPARALHPGDRPSCWSRPATAAARCWWARASTSKRWRTRWGDGPAPGSTWSATSR